MNTNNNNPSYKLDAQAIYQKYVLGEREFVNIKLSNADLRGIDLSFANLRGADLNGSDLSEAILKGADLQGANLNRANLNRARLQGANLSEAQAAWSSLIGADLSGANLSEASFDAATLTQAILQKANLNSAYLYGIDLSQTLLRGAYYNTKTRFEKDFNPIKAGMQIEAKITVEKLLSKFNDLSYFSYHYLGNMLTARYWKVSRPEHDWLYQFQVGDRSAQITFSGLNTERLAISQLQWSQLWVNGFIKRCSETMQDLPTLMEQQQLSFAIAMLDSI